jgi:hypothetical protein
MPAAAAFAAATIASAGINAYGASKASKTQAGAATDAANLQLGMFDTIRGDLAPYRQAGAAALPSYMRLLGVDPGSAGVTGGATAESQARPNWDAYLSSNPDVMAEFNRLSPNNLKNNYGINTPQEFAQWHYENKGIGENRPLAMVGGQSPSGTPTTSGGGQPQSIQAMLESLPGYQFTRDQGMKSVENVMAGRGWGGVSGALGKGLSRFVTGLADQTYGSHVDRMAGLANMGASAANQTGGYGTQAAQSAGGSMIGAGNAGAAGILGSTGAVGNAIQTLGMYRAMQPQFTPSMANNLISSNPNLF